MLNLFSLISGNSVSAYTIDANGGLKLVPGLPFATGITPWSVAVNPTGKFVYVANLGTRGDFNGSISGYGIGTNGTLTPVPGSPFPAGRWPRSVAVIPRVTFTSSFAKLEIAKRSFVLGELFTLGAISNGINPRNSDNRQAQALGKDRIQDSDAPPLRTSETLKPMALQPTQIVDYTHTSQSAEGETQQRAGIAPNAFFFCLNSEF